MIMKALDGHARGSRRVFGQRLARLAGCAAVSVVGVALAAAPALGATATIHIVTNVSGPGPGYQLQARLKALSGGAHILTITNPSSNASVGSGKGILTGVELDGPGGFPPEGNPDLSGCTDCSYSADGAHTSDAGDGNNTFAENNQAVSFDEGTQDGTCQQSQPFEDLGNQVAVCDFASEGSQGQAVGGVPPGQSVTITYTTGSTYSTPTIGGVNLYRVEEHFDFNDKAPACRPSGYGSEARDPGAFSFGAVAAGSCTVPATPRIDKVQIHPQQHTARFHQKAKGATKFTCELLHNGKVLFLHSCGAWKWYANPLRPGRYDYLVWGVNRAGRSKTAAFQSFRMS